MIELSVYCFQEFIQVYGASDFAYWCGHYVTQLLYALAESIPIALMCWWLLEDINVGGLFVLLLFFFIASVSMMILITAFFQSTRVALFYYTFMYLLMMVPYVNMASSDTHSTARGYAMMLLPPSAFACGLDKFVGGFQATGVVTVPQEPSDLLPQL